MSGIVLHWSQGLVLIIFRDSFSKSANFSLALLIKVLLIKKACNQLWGFGGSAILSMDSRIAASKHLEIVFMKLNIKHEINDYQNFRLNFQTKHIFACLLVSVFSLGFAKQLTCSSCALLNFGTYGMIQKGGFRQEEDIFWCNFLWLHNVLFVLIILGGG